MAKVYLVTEGSYSDYGVHAVFSESQKERAKRMAVLIGGGVEEYPLNIDDYKDPGMDHFNVLMRKNGEANVEKHFRLDCVGDKYSTEVSFRTEKDWPGFYRKSHWLIYWRGYAKSKEHAIRSADELRRQILAGQRPEVVDFGKN